MHSAQARVTHAQQGCLADAAVGGQEHLVGIVPRGGGRGTVRADVVVGTGQPGRVAGGAGTLDGCQLRLQCGAARALAQKGVRLLQQTAPCARMSTWTHILAGLTLVGGQAQQGRAEVRHADLGASRNVTHHAQLPCMRRRNGERACTPRTAPHRAPQQSQPVPRRRAGRPAVRIQMRWGRSCG